MSESRIRVMLVDDQPIIGEAVRRMLAPFPEITFKYCRDGAKAVAEAVDFGPTVLLQDLVMPDADGMELVSAYRAQAAVAEVPLIVLSSKEEATTKAEAFARGANDYLVKLPDPVEVLARIRYHSRGYVAQLERNAAYAALAESERHLQEEVTRAAEYVTSLLPEPLPPPVATAWRFVPSASLGGDCFGYHWIDDDRLAVYLLDVCGHGVGPALLSVSVTNMLRAGAVPGADPGDPGAVLAGLNAAFPMEKHNQMFFTMFYSVYSRGSRSIRWSSAGHPPAMLLAPGGGSAQLGSQGLMVGAVADMGYDTAEAPVAPGSRMVVYSDGLFELQRPDGLRWTMEEFLAGLASDGTAGSLDDVLTRCRGFQQHDHFEDDASLLEVRFPA